MCDELYLIARWPQQVPSIKWIYLEYMAQVKVWVINKASISNGLRTWHRLSCGNVWLMNDGEACYDIFAEHQACVNMHCLWCNSRRYHIVNIHIYFVPIYEHSYMLLWNRLDIIKLSVLHGSARFSTKTRIFRWYRACENENRFRFF